MLSALEQKLELLLHKYQELAEEKEQLTGALSCQAERVRQLEKTLDLLTQDREKVKTKIDQLLHRLKTLDV